MTGPQPTGVLMLSAVATRLGGPDTGEEQRQVDRMIREARYRDGLALHTAQAVQGEDILGHLLDHEPTVLHFSGHASDTGLRVLTPDGGDAPLVTEGLGDLLAAAGKQVRLVVLNACATDPIAQDLAEVTGCAIGYPAQVSDRTAITFATQFYRCVGAGMPVGPAYEAARAVIRMYGADENELPVLRQSPAVNMDALHLLHPAFLPPPPAQGRIPDPTAFLARRTGTKRHTVLATGPTDSGTELRAELADGNMNVQWIQVEETTERG
ncbi:CHAT domain-containing protein [Streptomyces sp. NPDC017958]|uniref:CHAT domain-containing protein n=1 Tax=Streptomyces sp. NPDC017958 TaxID=3365021 RepID=UPI00378DF738